MFQQGLYRYLLLLGLEFLNLFSVPSLVMVAQVTTDVFYLGSFREVRSDRHLYLPTAPAFLIYSDV